MDVPADLRRRIDAALRGFVEPAAAELDAIGEELHDLTRTAAAFVLGGGKRLRPAFCYWAARAVGATDTDALIRAAASLELVQACALVHDDVIDRSATRRGQPAVHEQFALQHHTNGWSGDPVAFGSATAILLGDLYLVWADSMLATSGVPADALARARPVYDTMRAELMAGQFLDVVEQARGGGPVASALRVARFKAAKYTVERPLHLGAAIGAGDAAVFETFSRYGLPLGEAFQLRDDLLGVFGDPELTGKPAGDDLREGKRTVLVALTIASTDDAGRAAIGRHLGDAALDDSGVTTLREIVRSSGAATEIERMIAARVESALTALAAGDLEPAGREALVSLATAATRRND